MFGKLFTPASDGKFELPLGTYYIARAIRLFRRCVLSMSALETRRMRRRPDWVGEVDRPVWITGMARAGTTISLEILSQHPDVATHRYFHIPNPHLPYWWERFISFLPLPAGIAAPNLLDALEMCDGRSAGYREYSLVVMSFHQAGSRACSKPTTNRPVVAGMTLDAMLSRHGQVDAQTQNENSLAISWPLRRSRDRVSGPAIGTLHYLGVG